MSQDINIEMNSIIKYRMTHKSVVVSNKLFSSDATIPKTVIYQIIAVCNCCHLLINCCCLVEVMFNSRSGDNVELPLVMEQF